MLGMRGEGCNQCADQIKDGVFVCKVVEHCYVVIALILR